MPWEDRDEELYNPVQGECLLYAVEPRLASVTKEKASCDTWSSHRPNFAHVKGKLQLSAYAIKYVPQVLPDNVSIVEGNVMRFSRHVLEEGDPVDFVSEIRLKEVKVDEPEEVMFMQRKRPRSPSPRRRRRGRAQRMQDRSRQENHRHWTRGHARGTP